MPTPVPIKKVKRHKNNLQQVRVSLGALRRKRAYTQKEIREAVGIGRYRYDRIENYQELPLKPLRTKICKFLDVDEASIWPGLPKRKEKKKDESDVQEDNISTTS